MHTIQTVSARVLFATCLSATAFADEAAPLGEPAPAYPNPEWTPAVTEQVPPEKLLGIGYKLGNGIGFAGADLIVNPLPHLSLDLQVAQAPVYSGYGLAPSVQFHLFAGRQSTPYVGAGVQYVSLSSGDLTGTATGYFANVGYEWKWLSGLGILAGIGVQKVSTIEATSSTSTSTLSVPGGTALNLEFGVRYMFL